MVYTKYTIKFNDMRRPNLLYTSILVLMSFIIMDDIQAQRRSTSSSRTSSRSTANSRSSDRSRTQDDTKLAEQWLAIHLGNAQFNGGFALSTKFSYGFEFYDRFSVGANARIFYNFVNVFSGPDLHLLDYGLGPQVRVKIVDEFFLIGEYNYNSFDQGPAFFRQNIWSAYVGAGYKSGPGPWTYGIHILYPLDEIARDFAGGIEYWIDFNYKF